MRRKLLLLVSPFFFPEPISTGRYNTVVAGELASSTELEVMVLCSHPIFPGWAVKASRDALPGVTIVRGGGHMRYPRNPLLRRAILELWFTVFVTSRVLALRMQGRRIEKIIYVFPPSLMAYLASFLVPRSCKVVGIVHDLQGVYAARGVGSIR